MKIRLTSKHYEFTRETEFSVTFQMSEKTSVCYAQARFNMATDIEPQTVARLTHCSVTENEFYFLLL